MSSKLYIPIERRHLSWKQDEKKNMRHSNELIHQQDNKENGKYGLLTEREVKNGWI